MYDPEIVPVACPYCDLVQNVLCFGYKTTEIVICSDEKSKKKLGCKSKFIAAVKFIPHVQVGKINWEEVKDE